MSEKESKNLEFVTLNGESFFKISNCDQLRPFFMSIVSDANHWMFISSNGGLTAGRKNAQHAIFPYYTDDKITESFDITGSKTILQIHQGANLAIWEPFSNRQLGQYKISRNLYKNTYGNKVRFEEINHDLQLAFSYQWSSSNRYGFVREATLINWSNVDAKVTVLDGIQNLVPHGVGSDTQNRASNLVDAYKRNELVPEAGLGIYALSAIIVDKAEPSEALKANIAWSMGLGRTIKLVSSLQLEAFRKGLSVTQETDIKGEKGAYFVSADLVLNPQKETQWHVVTNVNQNHADIVALCQQLKDESKLKSEVLADVSLGTQKLIKLNASSDALQCTSDALRDARHFSNTLFNIMRGGIFDNNYTIERQDFLLYLAKANKQVFSTHQNEIKKLPENFLVSVLSNFVEGQGDPDLERLCIEYLPLKFSRRHGDPSRPWNIFSINTQSEIDGSKILDYEGNWRDIFQNWEALAYSFPEFIDGMILKFFNASTFDGYNPYRVTKGGFDWEIIEPDDPWSYIGYWGDHQIIYSLKFLEFINNHFPNRLQGYFEKEVFVYANVPYKIKPYLDLINNPKDTITFDHKLDQQIREDRNSIGADAALIKNKIADIHRVNFIEKMLASVLAKVANLIPDGGIWMNTQRPEWNDANNALVGNGVSMVTLCYLRRYLAFFERIFNQTNSQKFLISKELNEFFQGVLETLKKFEPELKGNIDNSTKRAVLDGLGMSASIYREKIYAKSFSGAKQAVSLSQLKEFIKVTIGFCDHAIEGNKREDNLYHAYNLMTVEENGDISISYLSEMLEGQVAVLSSGKLSPKETLATLDGLKASALFRPDQYSYLLYPNKQLPGFLEKNIIPPTLIASSLLLTSMISKGDVSIVEKDVQGEVHFNGNFKNANDLAQALATHSEATKPEKEKVLKIFEAVFDHKSFTGRSGTFFGYEGLGSIYWHMVSKLLLAVQECCHHAIISGADAVTVGKLLEHFYEINEGIGVHKSPALYGAFPTDPYSHTPAGKGAQQPGMTGQVKEDILSRFGELGLRVEQGQIAFKPSLLREEEFLTQPKAFNYIGLNQVHQTIDLPIKTLGFTYNQVPIIYKIADKASIEVTHQDASRTIIEGQVLNKELSQNLFKRQGEILKIEVCVAQSELR